MKPHKVTSQWWDHATLWDADDPTLDLAGHTTDGGRVFGITRLRYEECDHYGCKSVVVISPEDREQVERLVHVFSSQRDWYADTVRQRSDAMQAALREFANPTPPKPEEPTGLGAVVEDADGANYTRVGVDCWVRRGGGLLGFGYGEISAVRVLNEGVQP